MGSFTAQILVGHAHQNDGGIIPSHALYLSEDSRPAWLMGQVDLWNEGKDNTSGITWVPTLENAFEDALLMIGLYILKDDQLINAAHKYFNKDINGGVELYDDIEMEDLKKLYDISRNLKYQYKIAVTIFGSSLIEGNLKILDRYDMDVEVCKPVFSRQYSEWSQKTITNGKL